MAILPATSSTTITARSAPKSAAATLSAPITTAGGTEPSPLQIVAGPWLLRSDGAIPAGGVTVAAHLPRATGSVSTPFFATYDPATAVWTPVTSTYAAAIHTVSTVLPHFSIWGVLRFVPTNVRTVVKGVLSSLVGSVKIEGPQPSCEVSSAVVVTASPEDGTLNDCGQVSDASHVLVKVASTLAFPTDLYLADASQLSLAPPADIYSDIDQALFNATKGRWAGTVIPPGSEADVTTPLVPGQTSQMHSELDDVAYLVSIIESATQVLLVAESKFGAAAARETVSEVGQGSCATEVSALSPTAPLDRSTLQNLASVGFECANQIVDLGAASLLTAVLSIVASIFENIVQTAFLAVETTIGWSTGGIHIITVSRAAAPDFVPFAGQWEAHERGLMVQASGAGVLSEPDYPACPNCIDADIPINSIVFQLNSVSGSTATGTITSATDTTGEDASGNVQAGSFSPGSTITLTLNPASPGQFINVTTGGGFIDQLCDPTADTAGQCGA